MKEKFKGEGLRKSLFKARKALKFTSMVLALALIVQVATVPRLYGQDAKHKVTGKVISATDNAPVPGASVQIKGTGTGTVTSTNGDFVLDAKDNDIIVVSFIGFVSEEIPVAGNTTIEIKLVEDATKLDEVVVIGYGVQKKKLVTGATMNVKSDQIQKQSTTSVITALQGQTPGLNFTSTSGQPGSGFKAVMRGVGSLSGTNPLYIVDGVQTGDISYLNTSDIESIDVLKDAASAAIYGAQSSNGVILVTTKQGKAGKAQITFDGYMGVQSVNNRIRTLNSKEYATIMNEQAVNSGKLPYFNNTQIDTMSTGTDWLRQFIKDNVTTQNYALTISGGNENTTYSTGLSYTQQGGVVGGKDWSNYERYGFRLNSDHKIYKDIVKLGQHLTFSYTNTNGIAVGGNYNNTLRNAFNGIPFIPVYDKNGVLYDNSSDTWNNGAANPWANLVYNNQNKSNNQKLLTDIYLEVNPIKNLTFKSTFGIDYGSGKYHSYKPVYKISIFDFNDHSTVNQNMFNNLFWTWSNTLSYKLKINEHQIDAMAGMSAQRYDGTNVNATNADLAFNSLDYAYLGNTTYKNGALMTVSGAPSNSMLASYFGRIGYNFKEKYMINATLRADGSSNFAANNRWGIFPSVSAGWTLSNESFMQNIKSTINFLKLRASWGQVGNQSIGDHAYLATILTSNTNYIFGNTEGQLTPGAYQNALGNANLKWETMQQTDLGLDAVVLNNKLSVTVDWYNKTNKDWLIAAPILATAGADPPFINGGNVVNKGIEFSATWSDKIGKLSYSIGANVAYNQNKVGSIPTSDGIVHGESNQLWNNAPEFYRAQSGYPLGYFWGFKTLGVFQTAADVQAYKDKNGNVIQPTAQPGDLKYADIDGDGQISSKDKTNIGDPNPDYTFGFNISLNYKGFDLSILGTGVAGNQIVQSYRNQTDHFANYTTDIFERWHGAGSSNKIPRLTEDGKNFTDFSDIYIQNGDFLRISNITLGYDFGKLVKLRAISQLRLFLTVQNLYTFTKYTGMDPELGYGNTITNGQVNYNFSQGIDYGYYPHPTTYLVGFNIKF